MGNLGSMQLGDSVRFRTELTNLSDVAGDVNNIQVSVVDDSNTVLVNATDMTHVSTGVYRYDLYLNPSTFSTGMHHIILTGHLMISNKSFNFYNSDYLSIEENRLI